MKKSIQMILDYFPMLEEHINDSESTLLRGEILSKLDNPQRTFLSLMWFFENPDNENFNLESLYKNLDGDWLSIALESIITFFSNDTYLIKEPTFSIVTEKATFFNQAEFVKFLDENKDVHGRNFSRPMLNTYLKRGDIPQPDLVVGNSKFWKEETCKSYLSSLKENTEAKK